MRNQTVIVTVITNMATEYFVIVSQLKREGHISVKKCGRLWATHFSKAEIEAGQYRDKLNNGKPLEVLLGDFYVVTAVPWAIARSYRNYDKFCDRRVTDKPNEKDNG